MYSQVGHSWVFPREGTEAKPVRHRSARNAECVVFWAKVQSMLLAHWQATNPGLESF